MFRFCGPLCYQMESTFQCLNLSQLHNTSLKEAELEFFGKHSGVTLLLSRPFVPVPEIDPKSGPPFGVRSCCQEVIQEEIKKLTQERTSLRKEMKSNRKKAKNAAKRKKRLVKARSSR